MLHVRHVSAAGGTTGLTYTGISPISVLTNSLDFETAIREFSLDQVESSARASFILQVASLLDDTKKQAVLDSFRSFYSENGGVLLQEMGTTITPIEQKFMDTKVFEAEKVTRRRVYEVFGLPDPDATSYNTREQEALEYLQETIIPLVTQYESELDRKLLTTGERARGLHFKFNVTALLRGDMATRMDFYFKGVRTGLFKPNECRAWEELPPETGGDKLYMSRDLSPVGSNLPPTV